MALLDTNVEALGRKQQNGSVIGVNYGMNANV